MVGKRSKMVRSVCCISGCPNNSTDSPDLDYHHLPYSDERRRKWLENMRRLDVAEKSWNELKCLKICGAHFTPEQYRSPLTRRLNIGAIPTIFVHEPEIPLPTSQTLPTNPAGLQEKASEEIPTIELPGTSQVFDLKKIISRNISNILRTRLGESPDLTVPAALIETAELEEFVEIPTIKPEILPGNRQGAVPTVPMLSASSRVNVDEPEIPLPISPTNPAGLQETASEEIPTIDNIPSTCCEFKASAVPGKPLLISRGVQVKPRFLNKYVQCTSVP